MQGPDELTDMLEDAEASSTASSAAGGSPTAARPGGRCLPRLRSDIASRITPAKDKGTKADGGSSALAGLTKSAHDVSKHTPLSLRASRAVRVSQLPRFVLLTELR